MSVPSGIGAVENAMVERLLAASPSVTGYTYRSFGSWPKDFDGPDFQALVQYPACWASFGGANKIERQGATRWKVDCVFAMVVAAENRRNEESRRRGGTAAEPGSYQLATDALQLLAGQNLGLDIQPLIPVSILVVETADVPRLRLVSIYAVHFITAIYLDSPPLAAADHRADPADRPGAAALRLYVETVLTSFVRPTRQQLIDRDRADFNARLPGADSNLRRSFVGGMATAHAGGLDGLYGDLDYIADQIMPDSADQAHLVRWASIWNVTPLAPTAASGAAASTGENDLVVPAGSVLRRGDGASYTTTADATVAADTVTIQAMASLVGSAGACDPGVILTLVSPIAGVSSTFTVGTNGLVGGNDAESPASLLARLLARIRNPPKGGGPGDYQAWALAVPGVTRAWELPLWMGLGSVGLAFVFDGRDDIFPTSDDVTAMQAYLQARAPVEATVYAFAPTPLPIDFTIQISPNTTAVQTAITAELTDFFLRDAQVGAAPVLLRSQYDQAISLAEGETDHLVTSPAGNLYPGPGQLAVLGDLSWAG